MPAPGATAVRCLSGDAQELEFTVNEQLFGGEPPEWAPSLLPMTCHVELLSVVQEGVRARSNILYVGS
jgi:hypothetical protein